MKKEKTDKLDTFFKKYTTWIRNAGEGATVENFYEDWDPIGQIVLGDLVDHGYAKVNGTKILLTE